MSCAVILVGCEVPTSLELTNGPSFLLNGSGRLASFTIYSPQAGHRIATPNDADSEIWSIQAIGFAERLMVAHMNVRYGSVPPGYKQTTPASGNPPALGTGFVYYFLAETTGAQGVEGFFYVSKAGPTRINVPDLCPSGFVGDVKPIKCATHEPYIEPKDIEQLVRDNTMK